MIQVIYLMTKCSVERVMAEKAGSEDKRRGKPDKPQEILLSVMKNVILQPIMTLQDLLSSSTVYIPIFFRRFITYAAI